MRKKRKSRIETHTITVNRDRRYSGYKGIVSEKKGFTAIINKGIKVFDFDGKLIIAIKGIRDPSGLVLSPDEDMLYYFTTRNETGAFSTKTWQKVYKSKLNYPESYLNENTEIHEMWYLDNEQILLGDIVAFGCRFICMFNVENGEVDVLWFYPEYHMVESVLYHGIEGGLYFLCEEYWREFDKTNHMTYETQGLTSEKFHKTIQMTMVKMMYYEKRRTVTPIFIAPNQEYLLSTAGSSTFIFTDGKGEKELARFCFQVGWHERTRYDPKSGLLFQFNGLGDELSVFQVKEQTFILRKIIRAKYISDCLWHSARNRLLVITWEDGFYIDLDDNVLDVTIVRDYDD